MSLQPKNSNYIHPTLYIDDRAGANCAIRAGARLPELRLGK